jgi:hypothetical protein
LIAVQRIISSDTSGVAFVIGGQTAVRSQASHSFFPPSTAWGGPQGRAALGFANDVDHHPQLPLRLDDLPLLIGQARRIHALTTRTPDHGPTAEITADRPSHNPQKNSLNRSKGQAAMPDRRRVGEVILASPCIAFGEPFSANLA